METIDDGLRAEWRHEPERRHNNMWMKEYYQLSIWSGNQLVSSARIEQHRDSWIGWEKETTTGFQAGRTNFHSRDLRTLQLDLERLLLTKARKLVAAQVERALK